ncbi:MAG: MBOAT family protein [Clostridium sp.]|nr:MBOAT family protein [Clostridium sp.]
MLFSSIVFIWIFLPCVLLGNFLLQKAGGNRAANVLLLFASIFFYAWGEPVYVLLMLFSIALNWSSGMALGMVKARAASQNAPGESAAGTAAEAARKEDPAAAAEKPVGAAGKAEEAAVSAAKPAAAKAILAVCVIMNLALLGYFKYAGMFVETVNALTGADFAVPQIALPIGISFFTFQALSYVIDVYRGECAVQKNVLKLALYVSFFPQLIAGPIVKYKDISDQIDGRKMSLEKTAEGIRRFIIGFGKKILLANMLGRCADHIYELTPAYISGGLAWTAALAYTFQIYYDFSGYSDMAIGLGRMFGFEFRENFLQPYMSGSIKEFWRRWHISLSSWFRDYVYIPLGGNRKGTARTYINLFIVFLLTGLWHGAAWNFVFWGIFHGCFLILERVGFEKVLRKIGPFRYVYAFFVANTGWVFFRADNIRMGFQMLKRMFLFWQYPVNGYAVREFLDNHTLCVMVLSVLGMGILQALLRRIRVGDKNALEAWEFSWGEIIFLTAVMVLSIMSLASSTYNPFIYFRF